MIKIGVIGYGYWGPNLVRNFSQMDGVEVTVVCDLSPERLDLARKRHPGIRTTTNAMEVIAHMGVDAVAIATPVASHYDLAIRALTHKKHVLVEKPLCNDAVKARELADLAKQNGVTLLVDHTFLYTGAIQKMKELIDTGAMGSLYYYDSVRVNLGLFQSDVNVLWDLAVHDLSIMDHLIAEKPIRVKAVGIQHFEDQPVDMAYLTLGFRSRMIAHVHVNWLSPVKIRRTLLGGSQKMVLYDDLEPSEKIRLYDKGVEEVPPSDAESVKKMLQYRRTGDMVAPKLNVTEALDTEARHFIRCIRGLEKPLSDGESGVRVVKILEAATVSLEHENEWIALNLG
ncbi:MAG: Gfo/Idh/MocA family oxidoreductase [Candidatus Sumerlaeia bacterium]|nr:Gfo/Idh/MocA family oxidoreductase [Candidatus Sumerlaeia bacterium]